MRPESKAHREARERLVAVIALCRMNNVDPELEIKNALSRLDAPPRILRAMAEIYLDIAGGGKGVLGAAAHLATPASHFWRGTWRNTAKR